MANKINQTAKVEVFPLPAEQPLIIEESIEKQQKGVNLNTNTQLQLEKIKQELESGKPSIGFIKEILENIDTFSSENKPFILGGIFGLLNQSDIGIKSLSGNKISLSQGKSQNSEIQNQYESLLNNAISARKINIRDIHNALLARTFSSLEEYNNTKFENSPKSSFDYAKFLLKKYGISIEVSDSTPDDIKEKIKNDSSQKAYFENLSFESQEKYENFISIIKSQTQNNSADRDFLVGFFDDFYHNKGENISKNSIVEISQTQNKNKAKILKEIGVFSDEQKATLGIDSEKTQEDFIKKISSDPLGAISDGFKGGAGAVALIFGLIGAIFGGKKGFGIGALLGFFTGMGGAEWLWDKGKEKLNKKQNKKGETSSDTPPEGNEIPKQNISIYTKYEGLIKGISSEKKEQARYLEVWKTLSSNDTLMSSKISEIPVGGSREEQINFFVDICGFDGLYLLGNQDQIQKIYETILNERKKSIGEYGENETLKQYLERTSHVNTQSTGGAIIPTKDKNQESSLEQNVNNSHQQKQEALNNKETQTSDISELETLQREGYDDLYILARGLELGYTFTVTKPTLPGSIKSMGIFGSTWYIITTPIRWNTYSYLTKMGGHYITGGLHQSMGSGILGKSTEVTGRGFNFIGEKTSQLLGVELRKEQIKLNNYLKGLDKSFSGNAGEIQNLQKRIQILGDIQTHLKAGEYQKAMQSFTDYKTHFDPNFKGFKKDGNLKQKNDSHINREIKKLENIDREIAQIEADTKKQIQDLEQKASLEKDPQKIQTLRTQAEDIAKNANTKITKINTDAGISLSKLDEQSIKNIAKKSPFVDNLIKANGGAEKFLTKFSGTGGKAFIGVGLISLLYNGREGINSILENGFSEENKNDAIDLGIGFIPVIGGIHDLKIAWDGKDLNNRTLNGKERGMRTLFGIVGLIPGGGLLVKGAFKGSTAVIKGADVAIHSASIVGKGTLYSALGYSIATATKEILID